MIIAILFNLACAETDLTCTERESEARLGFPKVSAVPGSGDEAGDMNTDSDGVSELHYVSLNFGFVPSEDDQGWFPVESGQEGVDFGSLFLEIGPSYDEDWEEATGFAIVEEVTLTGYIDVNNDGVLSAGSEQGVEVGDYIWSCDLIDMETEQVIAGPEAPYGALSQLFFTHEFWVLERLDLGIFCDMRDELPESDEAVTIAFDLSSINSIRASAQGIVFVSINGGSNPEVAAYFDPALVE